MAQKSRLEPTLCLRWTTERPYAGGSRESSTFLLLQDEYNIVIKLGNTYDYDYGKVIECEINLYRRSSHKQSYVLDVDCYLIARSKSYYKKCTLDQNYDIKGSRILFQDIEVDEICPSMSAEEWTVLCMFRDKDDPFSLQVENKTINLSLSNKNECVQVSPEIPLDMEALSSDISSLLEEEILPDFKLECGGRIFPVHRSVLAARSDVFRAMFRNKIMESQTGSTNIEDMEVPVLESFLKFLYSGQLEHLSEDTAASLYEIADKYAVRSLRKACSHWMEKNLSEENCISYLSIADSHSDPDLTAGIVSFIVKHQGIFKSADWLTFSEQHPALANKVFQAYFSSVSQ